MTYAQLLAYTHHRLDRNRPETLRRIWRVWMAGAGRREAPERRAAASEGVRRAQALTAA